MLSVAEKINNDYFRSFLPAVNSPPVPHRDVSTTAAIYRPYTEEYATIQRRVERPAQTEDLEKKKDKKWSIGKLFRRKKKEDESGTSSESDEGVSTRTPSKRKSKKKKKTPAVNNFDHIVIRDSRRAQSLAKPNLRDVTDDGVLSDPSAGFINYRANKAQEMYKASKESLSLKEDNSNRSSGLTSDTAKKTRKGRLKARVEALRNSMRGESSSDEESLKSSNSSLMVRFRSEDSLMRSRENSLNKRSRSARNERYIKRLSRDDENQLNKEAELLQQGYTKAEVEMLTRTPTSQSSGYGTCKRDQTQTIKNEPYVTDNNRRPMKSESISSFPSTQSYPSSINFNAKVNNEHINYSIPTSNNIKRESVYVNNNRERSVSSQYENPESIMCIKFPLGNVTNVKRDNKSPPVPPPRDMQRKVVTPVSMFYENNIGISDRMGNTQETVMHGVPNNDFERLMRRSQERTFSHGFNGLRRPISNSEDHIAMQDKEHITTFQNKSEQPRRPASVSAEPNHYGLYANSPSWRKSIGPTTIIKPEPVQLKHDYLYYADQSPRSRRPISIKSSQNGIQYLSDSQTSKNIAESVYRRPRNASEFWKKIDDAERQRRQQSVYASSRCSNDFSNSSYLNRTTPYSEQNNIGQENTNIHNKNKTILKSSSLDTTDDAKVWKATTEYKRSITEEPAKSVTSPISKTHVRHKSDTYVTSICQMPSDDEKSSERRKSTNLDDALNELEAIYNSLGLGDEDLLDRAERRELMTPKFNDHFNDWNGNDDEIQLRSQPTTPLRRIPRRSTLPDKLQDDMAFRRMNSLCKDKPNYKETQSQISYMLASPVYIPYASDDDRQSERNEPDIIHDDVMYRNIKQMNNRLKTMDPQPPFGIPIGPVSPAPQSDYLHAIPENKGRPRFIPRKSPDLVSDDLAYRNLRKDGRNSALFNGEDCNGQINNNQHYNDLSFTKDYTTAANLKKKRAVRSLSANIFSMIQKEIDDALNMSKVSSLQKTHSNSDVMKRLRNPFENNDNEQDHYPRNKVKQRHNTVSLFVNTTHAPTYHFAKDDSFIHSDDKHLAKPPSCDKSKNSSPSNRSPQSSKRSSKDEFQQVLSMLAQEAMDTSNKLGVALAELDKNRNNEKKSDVQNRISSSRQSFLDGLTNKSYDITEHELKLVNSQPVNESSTSKLVNDIQAESKGKKTEDSLLAISNQLNKVEDQLKHCYEKELNIEDESLKLSNYIAKAEEQLIAQESAVMPETKLIPDVIPLNIKDDSVKIETPYENNEPELKPPLINSLNPFLNTDDKVKAINEINAFRELKDGISDLIAGICQVNEKLFTPKKSNIVAGNLSTANNTGTTEACEKLNHVSQNTKEIPHRTSVNLSLYEDDLEIKKDGADSTEYNSSEELATIFQFDNKSRSASDRQKASKNNIRDELSSPKLVQSMNQQLRRLPVDQIDDCNPSQSNSLPTNVVPWRTKNQTHNSQKENTGEN